MNFDRFKEWWFDPVVQLLVAVKNSKTEADIKQWFVDFRERKGKQITDDDLWTSLSSCRC